jgi:hypothetical protein
MADVTKVGPLDEDDYEEIVTAATLKMKKFASGARGQMITVRDSLDWWVMKETERRIRALAEQAPSADRHGGPEDRAGREGRLQSRVAKLETIVDAVMGELSGNSSELRDQVASAIRGDGSDVGDTPWEILSDERKTGWRGDADRAIAAVKDYLITKAVIEGEKE